MSILKSGIQLTRRSILLDIILFAAFFTFYFVFSLHLLPKIVTISNGSLPIAQAVFSLTIAGSLLFSSLCKFALMKTHAILICCSTSTLLTIFLFFVPNYYFVLLSVALVGIFFSTAQLSFLGHFWQTTAPEERGRIGGIIGFATLPIYFILSNVIASNLDLLGTTFLVAAISSVPIAVIMLRPRKVSASIGSRKEGVHSEKKTILLFTIPWFLFSIVNVTIAKNTTINIMQIVSTNEFAIMVLIQAIATFIGTLLGGFMADLFGRRIVLAISVTLYGTGMALSGLVQNISSAYFSFFAEGLSWGILLIIYIFVIWGDLSTKEDYLRIYAIGLFAFYLSTGIEPLITSIFQIPAIASALLGCTLIFLSNVPIALAPEPLSQDFREKISLKMHIRTAKKIAEKFKDQG